MARYADTVEDQYGRPIEGASVYVYDQNEALATLEEDGGGALLNPVETDEYGAFHFNTADGVYQLDYHFGGRRLWRDVSVMVGTGPAIPDSVLTPLSGTSGSSYVGHIASGANSLARTVQSKLRDFLTPEDKTGDDDQKWTRALAELRQIYAQGDYLPNNTIFTNLDVDVTAYGATLSPQGAIWGFWSSGTTDESTAVVTAGATKGSIQITVGLGDVVKFQVGRYIYLTTDETGTAADAGATQYPIGWNKVLAADSGTGVITLLRPVPATYPGVATAHVVLPASFNRSFRMRGLIIDGTGNTHDAADSNGQAMRLQGYNEIDLDIETRNFTRNTLYVNPLFIYQALRVRLRYKDTGTIGRSVAANLQRIGDLSGDIEIDGSTFGVNVTEVDRVSNLSVHVTGRIKQEQIGTLSAGLGTSTRGFKLTGCGDVSDVGFYIQNCDTGVRVTGGVDYNFSRGGSIISCGVNDDSNGFNVSNDVAYQATSLITESVSVGPLHIVDQYGSCIAIQSDVVRFRAEAGGRLARCTKHAIFIGSANVKDVAISGFQIADWDSGGAAIDHAAIYAPYGGSFTNLIFRHATDITKPCFSDDLTAGRTYTIANIQRPDGNPLFPGAKDVETTGTATIPSGSTFIDASHLLIKTPTAAEISARLTANTTNPIGSWWISNITATQFRINVAADPGASGAIFAWHAALKMPFTA